LFVDAVNNDFHLTQNSPAINAGVDVGLLVDRDGDAIAGNPDIGVYEYNDADFDGITNSTDNCPIDANTSQSDFDNDGLGDVCDPDDDNDGLADIDEAAYGSNPFLADTDGDTLSDGDEVSLYSTNPVLADTDTDGFNDDVEITAGSDPNSNTSIPGVSSGDVNGDGNVDVIDVLLVTRIVLGELAPTTNQLLRADIAPIVNGMPAPDGVINTGDVVLIMKMAITP